MKPLIDEHCGKFTGDSDISKPRQYSIRLLGHVYYKIRYSAGLILILWNQ